MPIETTPTDTARPPAARTGRRRRVLLLAAAALLLLPLGVVAAAAMFLPTELIARSAAARAEAALGVPVAIGELAVDFWPVPSVALRETRVGPEGAPVARVGRILLRPRLLPLLRGQVTVREIAIDRPDIRLVVDSSGALNLPFGDSAADDAAADPSGAIDFAVDEFRIRDGRLSYSDARDGTVVVLAGLEQALRVEGRLAGGELARVGLAGRLSSDSVDAEVPGKLAAPLRAVRFAVDHDAELDRSSDRLEIASLRLELQQLVLSGSGRVDAASDSLRRSVQLELSAEEFSFADLARSMPEGFLAGMLAARGGERVAHADSVSDGAAGIEMDYAGRAAIVARVDGPVRRDSVPRIEGTVELRDVAVTRGGSALLAATAGAIDFSNRSVASRGLSGSLFGAPFDVQFRVDDLASPVAVFATRGTARVEELLALLRSGSEEPLRAVGAIPFDLRGRIEPQDPGASVVEGTVGLGGVTAELPSLLQPVRVSSGTVRFAGDELLVQDLALGFGESRVRAQATVAGWLSAALGDSTAMAEVQFDARAATLDLDALLGPSESRYTPLLFARLADRPIDGKSAEEAAVELGYELPELPRVRARGTLVAERLVRGGMTYEGVDLSVESSPQAVSVPRLRFGLMGGTVELGLALERGSEDATLVAVYHLENVGAGPFFSRFTPFQGRLDGLMLLDGEASLQLDRHLLPVRPTVRSSGQLALTSGSLASWPVLSRVAERLGVQSLDTLAFREWSGEFLVAGPLVSLQRSVQVSDRLETELAGSFDFAGKLDLGIVTRLSPALVAGAGQQVRAAANVVAGEEGSVPVGVRITGTAADPQIALDFSAARDAAMARARARATEEAEGAARRAAAEVARRALGDSAAVQPERVGETVRTEVRDRIRGLFGGGGRAPAGGAAAAPAEADSAVPADSAAGTAADSTAGG